MAVRQRETEVEGGGTGLCQTEVSQ
jgi:hypothetical protein